MRGCLGDGSGSWPALLSFGSSSLCAACYFREMVWAGSILEFLRSGASLATWQGGGSRPRVCGGQNGIRFRSSMLRPRVYQAVAKVRVRSEHTLRDGFGSVSRC